MNYSTWGTFSYLLPEIPEDSVVRYYFQAEDILHNFAETEIFEFVANYSITELEMPLSFQLVLGRNEGVLYKLDLSKLETKVKLFVVSDTEVFGDMSFSVDSDQNGNWTLSADSPFRMLSFLPDNDTLFISLSNLDEYADATITLAGTSVQNATIDEYNQTLTLSLTNPVKFYNVFVNTTLNASFYVSATSDSDFQFLQMIVFNESTIVKSHVFNRISVTVETTGEYYVLLGLLDDRVESVELDIEIAYGYIEDEPYWEVDAMYGGVAIPGYNLFLFMAFIGTVVSILIKRSST